MVPANVSQTRVLYSANSSCKRESWINVVRECETLLPQYLPRRLRGQWQQSTSTGEEGGRHLSGLSPLSRAGGAARGLRSSAFNSHLRLCRQVGWDPAGQEHQMFQNREDNLRWPVETTASELFPELL